MKKVLVLSGLLALVGGASVAQADVTQTFSNTPNPNSNLRGLHIDRPSSDMQSTPYGFSLDAAGLPRWDFGLAANQEDFRLFSHATQSNLLTIRRNTGQLHLGLNAYPLMEPTQMRVTTPVGLDGIWISTTGNQHSLLLAQSETTHKRVKVNFNQLFSLGTDAAARSYPATGADYTKPGPIITIHGGHHRLFEIAERVRAGKIEPETLIEAEVAR